MKGFEEKMSRIGRKFTDEMNQKADDAIEDLTIMMKNGDKVIDKLQKEEQKMKENEIRAARIDERKKILGKLKKKKVKNSKLGEENFTKTHTNKKSKPKKVSRSKPKKVSKSKKISKPKKKHTFKTKKIKPTKTAKQKIASLSPKTVKIEKEPPLITIAKEVIKKVGNKKQPKQNTVSSIKKNLIRNKIEQQQLARRIKIGEFISVLSNIFILISLAIFIYFKMISSVETTDSFIFWLSTKLLIVFILLILIGSFLKYNGLWYQITESIAIWQESLTFDFQLQFYLSIAFVILLQIWTFIVNGEYDELFPTKTPIYLFAGGLMFMCTMNLCLSIGNLRSRTGSLWVDFKDKVFKQMGMNYMVSDSTTLNPMDEMMQEFEKDSFGDVDEEDEEDEDDD
jgi:hypothetical protein